MLFFRSEERVDEWCEVQRLEKRPVLTLDQLWQLAVAWYDNRLTPDAHRPDPDEMRAIFGRVGLHGSFWDPQSDHFG